MGQFVIENFANGLDRRKSADTAPPGSLRVLRNAFLNEGGEIEKRKAFVRNEALTEYGQTPGFKGRITGPHQVPGSESSVFYRHRADTLPAAPWAAGAGSEAVFLDLNNGDNPPMRAWAMRSATAMANFGILFHAGSASEFGDFSHLLESYWPTNESGWMSQHIEVEFDEGEPVAQDVITANANRAALLTLLNKGYVCAGPTFFASTVADPGDMAGTGSGAVDTRTQSVPIGSLIALAEYYGALAVFGTRGVQFWAVDPDFAQNQYQRTIKVSLLAPRSVTGYADGDVLFLSNAGVRSLQARDSSNLARVSDVGSPIDSMIRAELDYGESPPEAILGHGYETRIAKFHSLARGAIHEQSGQFWLCLKDKIYVLSNYPSAKVLAWSVYDLPQADADFENVAVGLLKGRWVADIAPIRDDLIFRNFADETFIYGGADGARYDQSQIEVITPHMDMGRPDSEKQLRGIDLACYGEWIVEISLDVNNVEWERIAIIQHSSYHSSGIIPCDLRTTHLAIRLLCTSDYAAKLGQITVLYDGDDER